MKKTFKNMIFDKMIDLLAEPKWLDDETIEFNYDQKFMVLEFNPEQENLLRITLPGFCIIDNEKYKQIFDHVALKVSARFSFIKIIPDRKHYSIAYEFYAYSTDNFTDEFNIALNKMACALHEFFLRLDIMANDTSVKHNFFNQINLN